ncbi:MAG: nitrate ABC transporter, permease protein, partial [bacterium]|nr:nitrate ABC transporter, permease protein [bacterium]
MTFPKPSFTAAEQIKSSAAYLEPRDPSRMADRLASLRRQAISLVSTVLPPALTLALIMIAWQALCGDSYEGLPSPSRIWLESRELIVDPFYDHGGIDKGLFWQALTSLKR